MAAACAVDGHEHSRRELASTGGRRRARRGPRPPLHASPSKALVSPSSRSSRPHKHSDEKKGKASIRRRRPWTLLASRGFPNQHHGAVWWRASWWTRRTRCRCRCRCRVNSDASTEHDLIQIRTASCCTCRKLKITKVRSCFISFVPLSLSLKIESGCCTHVFLWSTSMQCSWHDSSHAMWFVSL